MEVCVSGGGQGTGAVNSRVKALLLKAWRERWSDIQWSIQLKKVLATHPGDTQGLAETLMQQAFVGNTPNHMIMSYIKNAVFSQVIAPSAAFQFITSFTEYDRTQCILGLVELAESFAVNLSFSNSLDGGLTLSRSLQSTLHWLMMCVLKSLQKIQDGHPQPEQYSSIIENASVAVQKIVESATVRALLHIARAEDSEAYREFEQTEVNVRGTVTQLSSERISQDARQEVATTLKELSRVQDMQLPSEPIYEVAHLPISPTINTLVTLEAVLNPTNDVQPFIDQLMVIEKLLKFSRPYLYCELLRACCMGLVDSKESQEELKWAAFTFLKLPQALLKVQQQSPGRDWTAELEQGFDLLLNSVPMLDLTDLRLNCDCLRSLLNECMKYNLLSETQHNRLLQRRYSESEKPQPTDAPNTQPSPSLILRAEPTVTSILKTLDADYSKNQDALLGVLCRMLSGKSFELILAAAAATGKLQSFAIKLIKFNEFARQTSGEAGKAAHTRALLFDISFLMLCHITQLYGTEIISSSVECSESFYVQWALRCLPEDGRYKCVDNCVPTEAGKVDALLTQFSVGGELKTSLARWHEVCINAPFAIQEVLFAWEHGAVTLDNVKMILENVKNRMCCLPVVVSAWLCSYMNTVGEESRAKPLIMLQQLKKTITPDASNQYYAERSHLMGNILKKMVNEILPSDLRSTVQQYIPRNALPSEVMAETLSTIFNKGWVDLKCLHTLEQLLNLCGSDWFCDRLVLLMLDLSRIEELNQALSLVFAVCHMDLEHVCLSLLLHTVPGLLQSSHQKHLLTDPRGYTLAKLCVMCITSAKTARTVQNDVALYRSFRKRSRKEVELEDMDEIECRPVKKVKTSLMEPQLTLDSDGFNIDLITARDDGESSPTFDKKDPLNKALISLFRLMNAIVHDNNLSPKISFIVTFIEEAIKCSGHYTNFILQFMPGNMLSQIMKCLPGIFTNQQIVHICDLTTAIGRKVAAKAVCQNSKYTQSD